MADLVQWGKIRFYASKTRIRGLADVTLTSACVTEDTTVDGEQFASVKSKGPTQVTLTGIFNAQIGETPQKSAKELLEAARSGTSGLLYFNGKKAFGFKFIATNAQISKVQFAPNGEWMHCEFSLTLKQGTKGDGETTSPGGPGGGGSRKYKVQIEGMAVLEVTASSMQGAVNQVCRKCGKVGYTGNIYIDGVRHEIEKGIIKDKNYKVQESGKAAKTVFAASKQEAVTKAGYGKFTGMLYIDGVPHNIRNGIIVTSGGTPAPDTVKPPATADTTPGPATSPAGVLTALTDTTSTFLTGLSGLLGGKLQPDKKSGK